MSAITKGYSGRVLLLATVVGAVAICMMATAQAQDNPQPQVEVFGGYAFLHPGVSADGTNLNLENVAGGWGAAATFMLFHHVGLTADFGGHYHTFNLADTVHVGGIEFAGINTHLGTVMFGPHIEARTSHLTFFGKACSA